jgi:dTDP-4-amino-4,6-dideoxygalactose transaminase
VLRVKLKHLNEYITARRKAADYYDQAFSNHPKIKIPFRANYSKHVFHQYTLIVEERRNELVEHLKSHDIPAMIYYPVACDQQKAFEGKGRIVGELKNTRWLSDRVVSLPMHTELDNDQLEHITKTVLAFYQ